MILPVYFFSEFGRYFSSGLGRRKAVVTAEGEKLREKDLHHEVSCHVTYQQRFFPFMIYQTLTDASGHQLPVPFRELDYARW